MFFILINKIYVKETINMNMVDFVKNNIVRKIILQRICFNKAK